MSDLLGEYQECPVCNRYGFSGTHRCGSEWQAIRPDYDDEDEPHTVFCDGDADDAACEFAAEQFSAWEYPSEVEVWIRRSSDLQWEKFDITVEHVPSFTATKKE